MDGNKKVKRIQPAPTKGFVGDHFVVGTTYDCNVNNTMLTQNCTIWSKQKWTQVYVTNKSFSYEMKTYPLYVNANEIKNDY